MVESQKLTCINSKEGKRERDVVGVETENYEEGDVNSVMDGNIMSFITEYLKLEAKKNGSKKT